MKKNFVIVIVCLLTVFGGSSCAYTAKKGEILPFSKKVVIHNLTGRQMYVYIDATLISIKKDGTPSPVDPGKLFVLTFFIPNIENVILSVEVEKDGKKVLFSRRMCLRINSWALVEQDGRLVFDCLYPGGKEEVDED